MTKPRIVVPIREDEDDDARLIVSSSGFSERDYDCDAYEITVGGDLKVFLDGECVAVLDKEEYGGRLPVFLDEEDDELDYVEYELEIIH